MWKTGGQIAPTGPAGPAGSAGNDLPKITAVTYTDATYTSNSASSIAPSTAGYIYLTGSNFQSGCTVTVGSTAATATYVSSTQVNVALAANSTGTYHLYLVNPDGGSTLKVNGVVYSPPITGGTISNSGGYTIHTFTSSDTFVLGSSKTVDYLVVAGGGAGGPGGAGVATQIAGGGGGAGGVIYQTDQSLTAGTYTITVGAGGGGVVSSSSVPVSNNGNNSSLDVIATAIGGGRGGTGSDSETYPYPKAKGQNGGSGGAPALSGADPYYGSGTSGQGYRSGRCFADYSYAGGGGGAGAVGEDGGSSGTYYGRGGAGRQISISGSAVYYGGGGQGGNKWAWDHLSQPMTGALGGGGGVSTANWYAQSGSPNTGGGGCGSLLLNYLTSGSGGSGIVIIRYLS